MTGTEGSIPPATSIDEDQIEIVTVIQNAKVGDVANDIPGDPTLGDPSHTDLSQLWKAMMSLFSQKYITTPITKTVHGAGADFVDLHAAMKWLAKFVITQTGFVTFMVAPGKWTYTQTVEINHPNANRVDIQGGALLGASPMPSNFSVTGYHVAADGSNQIIYLRSVYATELSFTGGVNGFTVLRPGTTLRYLLITGSQTIAPGGIISFLGWNTTGNGIACWADIWLDGIAVWGFGADGVLVLPGATVAYSSTLSVSLCYNGFSGLEVSGGNFLASNNSHTNIMSNAIEGVNQWGGSTWFHYLTVKGSGPPNGNGAIQCLQGGLLSVQSGGCELAICYAGVTVMGAASLQMNGAYIHQIGTNGVYAGGTCTVNIVNCTMDNIGNYSVIAYGNAYVDATGASFPPPWSPPFNTYNVNSGAWLQH